MIEHEIDIPTRDGAMNTFVAHPEEGGPFPPVFFYMDAPGKREELHDMARRIAAVGYWVALPNLYYRRTREFAMERTDAGMARMFEMMSHLTNTLVVHDTEALLAHADAQPVVRGGPVGAVGYCMSGPFVVWAAAAYPQRFACIASICAFRPASWLSVWFAFRPSVKAVAKVSASTSRSIARRRSTTSIRSRSAR